MTNIPLDTAQFFGILVDLALFGLYTAIFAITMWISVRRRRKISIAHYAVIVLYLLNIGRTAATITDAYWGFVVHPGGPLDYVTNHQNKAINKFTNIVWLLCGAIADTTLCWRLYIVWVRNWRVVVVPAILVAILIIGGITTVAFAGHGYQDSHGGPLQMLMYVIFGSTLLVNWLVTGLIVGRLWVVGRRPAVESGRRDEPYTKLIIAIVESGAIYSITTLIYLILYSAHHNAGAILVYSLPKIVGLVPTLIVLQMALGYVQPADKADSRAQPSIEIPSSRPKRTQTVISFDYMTNFEHETRVSNGDGTTTWRTDEETAYTESKPAAEKIAEV